METPSRPHHKEKELPNDQISISAKFVIKDHICPKIIPPKQAELPNDLILFRFRLPMRFPKSSAQMVGCILLILAAWYPSWGAEFVGGALHFEPPAIVGINKLTRAPEDMPFAGDALGIDCYTDPNRHGFGWIRLQFFWGGVPIRDGQRIKVSMETTNEFFQFVRDSLSKSARPMSIATFQGLPSITTKSTNSSPRGRLHEGTIVHVKTNIMFRMSVSAETEAVFDALTASLKTVKIEPEKLFEFIRPREPNKTIVDAATVEIGFAPIGGQEILAAVFKGNDSIWSIVGGYHGDKKIEQELLERLSKTLNDMGKQSIAQGTTLRATVDIASTGDGPDDVQRSIIFQPGDIRNHRGEREGEVFSVSRLSHQKVPDGFRKVLESPFKVNLSIEDHRFRYPYKLP